MTTMADVLFHKGFDFGKLGMDVTRATRAIAPESYEAMRRDRRRQQKRDFMRRVRSEARSLGIDLQTPRLCAAVKARRAELAQEIRVEFGDVSVKVA